MYSPKYHPDFIEKISEIKNKKSKENLLNKISDIMETINTCGDKSFKNLRKPLQKFKRVHVNKSFVILFEINNEKQIVCFRKYEHHDNIYK